MMNPLQIFNQYQNAKRQHNFSEMDSLSSLLCLNEGIEEQNYLIAAATVLFELAQSREKEDQALFKKYINSLASKPQLSPILDHLFIQGLHDTRCDLNNFVYTVAANPLLQEPLRDYLNQLDIDEMLKVSNNFELINEFLKFGFNQDQKQKIFEFAIHDKKLKSKIDKLQKTGLIINTLDVGFIPPDELKTQGLLYALENSNYPLADRFYELGATLSKESGQKIFQETIQSNDVKKICYLINSGAAEHLNEEHIEQALKRRDGKIVKSLLQSHLDGKLEKHLYTTLIAKGEWDLILPFLLKSDLSEPSHRHLLEKALSESIKTNKFNIATQILKNGIRFSPETAQALITECVSRNYLKRLRFLLDNGAGKYINENDMTDALQHANNKTIECLIKHHWEEKQQKMLLMSAVSAEKWNVVELLLAKGLQLSKEQGQQLLIRAIKAKKVMMVEWLLNHGVDASFDKSIALVEALKTSKVSVKIVQMLLDNRADPKTKGMLLPVLAIDRYSETWNDKFLDVSAQLLTPFLKADEQLALVEMIEQIKNNELEVDVLKTAAIDWISASFSEAQKMAFSLVLQQEKLRKLNEESSMEGALMNHAKKHFDEVVEPTLKDDFMRYPGASEMDKVAQIEKEIKSLLLDEILKANFDVANQSNEEIAKSHELVAFIKENYQTLIEGEDNEVLALMRAKMTSNEDNAQIAWRGYDKDAHCDPGWPNLLTTPLGLDVNVFGGVSLKDASDMMRKRVAYYFIAQPMVDVDNFIGQLADIRRAHFHPRLDSPTCYPGGIGRISEMGRGHPYLQLPPLPKDIIHLEINKLVLNHYGEMIKSWNTEQQQQLYLALTMLASGNAEDIVEAKTEYEESWLRLRAAFIDGLGEFDEIKAAIKSAICEALKIDEATYSLSILEENLIDFELMDIAFGRNASLYERIQNVADEKINEVEKIAIANPFNMSWGMLSRLPSMLINKYSEKRLNQYIEFELLRKPCENMLQNADEDTIARIIKELVEEAFACDSQSFQDKIKTACDIVFSQYAEIVSLPVDEQEKLKRKIVKASSFTGISDKQQQIVQGLLDKLKIKDSTPGFTALLDQCWDKISPMLLERTEQIYHNRKKLIMSGGFANSAEGIGSLSSSQDNLRNSSDQVSKKKI